MKIQQIFVIFFFSFPINYKTFELKTFVENISFSEKKKKQKILLLIF